MKPANGQNGRAGGEANTDSIYANREAVFRATNQYNRGAQIYVRTADHGEARVDAIAEASRRSTRPTTWTSTPVRLKSNCAGRRTVNSTW
jgi:hypothetical protein